MSSISGILSSAVSGGDSGGGSVASQVAALNKQIQNVLTQVKELADNKELTDEQKSEMQQMYQSQITMLQAQIAQLEQKQAKTAVSDNKKKAAITAQQATKLKAEAARKK